MGVKDDYNMTPGCSSLPVGQMDGYTENQNIINVVSGRGEVCIKGY